MIGYTDEEVRSLTQEVRLRSKAGTPLQWSAGLFAARTEEDITPGYFMYDGTGSLTNAETTARDLAVFGELKHALTPTVEIAGGLRYQMAKREASNDLAAPFINSGEDDWNEILPSLSATWSPTADLSVFAKYSRGFRAGGFNAHKQVTSADDYAFEAETSDHFELGFRAQPSERLKFGGAIFYSTHDDYQVLNQISPSVFAVNNADEVTTYGAEVEAEYAATDALTLFGSAGVTKAEYDRFANAFGNWAGNDVPFIPAYTANYGFEYTDPSGFFGGVQGRLTGEYQLNDANTLAQGSVHLVDAQVGYRADDYEIVLYGANIFDKRYIANIYDFSSTPASAIGAPGDRATYGLRVKYTF